jgi:hypothetical protein
MTLTILTGHVNVSFGFTQGIKQICLLMEECDILIIIF